MLLFVLCVLSHVGFAEGDHITILNMETFTPRYKEAVRLFHLRYWCCSSTAVCRFAGYQSVAV